MKKHILMGVGVLVALTGCTAEHQYVEKQTVVPVATLKPATTTIVTQPNAIALPQPMTVPQQQVIMAPGSTYQATQYQMPQQYPMQGGYGQQQPQQMPQQQPQQEARGEEVPVRANPMSDVNYDINKIYCCDFPVSYRKKKCTNCN